MISPYIHSICWHVFDSQEELDVHVADLLADLVCRINEGMLLEKGPKEGPKLWAFSSGIG